MVRTDGFKHLDPSSTKIYKEHTVLYGFETEDLCFMAKVRNGYLVETPMFKPWARGQHIDTLLALPCFTNIIALRICD